MTTKWDSNFCQLLRRALIASLATIIGQAAFGTISSSLAEPNGKESRAPVKVEITGGARSQLCREYAEGLTEWRISTSGYCGVALPSGARDFRLPKWEDLHAAAHMELVREIFYWSNLSIGSVGQEKFYQQLHTIDALPDLFEQIWEPARPEVEALVAAGKVKLQRSVMDFDHDGKREPVYRMTYIYRPFRWRTPPTAGVDYQPVTTDVGIIGRCTPTDLPDGDHLFVYFVRKEDSPAPYRYLTSRHLRPAMSVFFWRGRSYLRDENEINDPMPPGDSANKTMAINSVCRFRQKVISAN